MIKEEIREKLYQMQDLKYKKFIPKIDSWAVCDVVCSSLKIANKEQDEMWKFIE